MKFLPFVAFSKRYQFVALVMSFLLVMSAAIYSALKFYLYPIFEEYEQALAATDLARVEQAIEGQFDAIAFLGRDYAEWDDVYQFVESPDSMSEMLQEEFVAGYWYDYGIQLLLIINHQGELVWGKISEPEGEAIGLDNVVLPLISGNPLLTSPASVHSHTRGFIDTPMGLMMIASSPVLHSDGSGPVAGSFIVGRVFDDQRIREVAESSAAEMTLFSLSDPELSGRVRDVPIELEAMGKRFLARNAETDLLLLSQLRDLYGDPVAVIQTASERRISVVGTETINEIIQLLMLLMGVLALIACVVIVVSVPGRRRE